MTFDELVIKDKQCKQVRLIRNLIIPIGIVVFAVTMIVMGMKGLVNQALLVAFGITTIIVVAYLIVDKIFKSKLSKFEICALNLVGQSEWKFVSKCDVYLTVKSKQAATNLDYIKFFKADNTRLPQAIGIMEQKQFYKDALNELLSGDDYKSLSMYKKLANKIKGNLQFLDDYYIVAHYSSPTGKSQTTVTLTLSKSTIKELEKDKSLLMSKTEYNRYLKEQAKEELEQKQHSYYDMVNLIIDYANENKDTLVNSADADKLDGLIASLFDRTINSIKKIKTLDSEEWDLLDKVIKQTDDEVYAIVDKNNQILAYYNSEDFLTIKNTCDALMSSQREFNEYIDEKVKSISNLFGKNIVRNETAIEDEYNYIHPYKKSITPFTAEVSATVFASAENNPLDYVVKQFYPNKAVYPEQIQKLQLLVEELETLKEAKQIIENYKQDVQQYLSGVPAFIMENDEEGFYSRLGFATINENTLTVEYKFSYTSNGGKAQRSFTVPMTEETIIRLIEMLESKLTMSAFTKEQRSLMTSKLRQQIKERDNFTCKFCGNSTHAEPNLLLEVDHIVPVSKGGYTVEDNLQTLCWKCNRSKSAKLI